MNRENMAEIITNMAVRGATEEELIATISESKKIMDLEKSSGTKKFRTLMRKYNGGGFLLVNQSYDYTKEQWESIPDKHGIVIHTENQLDNFMAVFNDGDIGVDIILDEWKVIGGKLCRNE